MSSNPNSDSKTTNEPHDLVVIGSSAGGIEALSMLVSTLTEDFPAPVVVAQHLDPTHPSNLSAILQRHTPLQVQLIEARTELQVGTIYVVPSNRHVIIKESEVVLQEDNASRPRPSVDLLLSTAARAYGDHLIAVILTGFGTDGSSGAVDVKNSGGTVIVQSRQTARFPSMPSALPRAIVDFEVELEKIGPLLSDLLAGVITPPTTERSEDVLRNILGQVNRQVNIDFRPYKTKTIMRRISRRMIVTHCQTMSDYALYLETHPEEIGELVNALLINVTQFFRDGETFNYLRTEILPTIIEKARKRDRVLRFWSAGCATGEEPYSLAMILADMLEGEIGEWSIKIFATDLDEASINFARRGVYSEALLKDVPESYRSRFFETSERGFVISKTLRQMVIFGLQDLSRSSPFPRIDLLLCRNVLIYFTPELQDFVLSQFSFSLFANNGYLLLGKAETVRASQSNYEQINKQWKIYRCINDIIPTLRRNNFSEYRNNFITDTRTIIRVPGSVLKIASAIEDKQPPTGEMSQLRRFNEVLMRFLPVGLAVIDRSYRLLTVNTTGRRLLGLRDIAGEQDFLHAVRGIPYSMVRNTIDTVFRERTTVTLSEIELDSSLGGNGRCLSFSVALMQTDGGLPDLAIISINDVTEQIQTRRELEASQIEQAKLLSELSLANQRLNEMNKELTDANEELQVANEELVLTHEELQATIEEYETTNEELQATNEEMETNNEELQATNEELQTTNEEMRARTSELQEVAIMLESERLRLSEMVELAPFYVMVLRGPNLVVEPFNPRYAELLGSPLLRGRPIEQILNWSGRAEIVELAHRAFEQDKVFSSPAVFTQKPDTSESFLVHTVVPSHDINGRVSGVIVYTLDVTEQRAYDASQERERLRLIFNQADQIALALYDATTMELLIGNHLYLQNISDANQQLDAQKLLGRTWKELNFASLGDEAEHIWMQVLEKKQPYHTEVRRKLADGNEKIWNWTLTPVSTNEQNQTNKVRYMLISAIDITEQVQAREVIEETGKQQNQFLSLVTHELRSPMTSISGYAQLLRNNVRKWQNQLEANPDQTIENFLKEQKGRTERQLTILDTITNQVQRSNALLGELSDISKMRTGRFELQNLAPTNVVELVNRIVEQKKAIDQSHPITVKVDQQEIMAVLDEKRVSQVLENLLNNAIKYSLADKPITISVKLQNEAQLMQIAVQDEGDGIALEAQPHVFEQFYRANTGNEAKVDGLGLGLFISRGIVQKHGGRIWFDSTPGAGTTFFVELPLEQANS